MHDDDDDERPSPAQVRQDIRMSRASITRSILPGRLRLGACCLQCDATLYEVSGEQQGQEAKGSLSGLFQSCETTHTTTLPSTRHTSSSKERNALLFSGIVRRDSGELLDLLSFSIIIISIELYKYILYVFKIK